MHAPLRLTCLAAILTLSTLCFAAPGEIKHRFLAVDESRSQLLYVDQVDESKSWAMPAKHRDLQLIGERRLLLSTGNGWREYNFDTQKLVSEYTNASLSGCMSVRRRKDGSSVVACAQSNNTVYILDATNALLKRFEFPGLRNVRLARLSSKGTILFGANNMLCEASLTDGLLIRSLPISNAKHIYQALSLPNGNTIVATGYGASVLELSPVGATVKQWGGKPGPDGMGFNFFAGMQVLQNGNVLACNWTGHKAEDSSKGVQLVEFDASGKIVWTWQDAKRAGTLHGVIVLDGLDLALLHDERSGTLSAVR